MCGHWAWQYFIFDVRHQWLNIFIVWFLTFYCVYVAHYSYKYINTLALLIRGRFDSVFFFSTVYQFRRVQTSKPHRKKPENLVRYQYNAIEFFVLIIFIHYIAEWKWQFANYTRTKTHTRSQYTNNRKFICVCMFWISNVV